MNIKNRVEWLEHYSNLEVDAIELLLKDRRDVTLFKCECCNKWSAISSSYGFITLPVSETSLLDTCEWIRKNEFSIKSVIIDEDTIPIEQVDINSLL